jgi:hypothetical protein
MLHVGLDLSRRRLDFLALTEAGERLESALRASGSRTLSPPASEGKAGVSVVEP